MIDVLFIFSRKMWDPFFSGGRLITTDEEERKKEIERLRKKYHDILVEYAKFQAEYPYTTKRAAKIIARRNRPKRPKLRGVKSEDPEDDLVYPLALENLKKAKKKMPTMKDTRTQEEILDSYARQMEESPGNFAMNFDESRRNIRNAKPVILFEVDMKKIPFVQGLKWDETGRIPHLKKWLSKEFGRSAKVFDSSSTKFLVTPVDVTDDLKTITKVHPQRFYTWFSSATGGKKAVIGIDIANTDALKKFLDFVDDFKLAKTMDLGNEHGIAVVGSEKYPQRHYNFRTMKASGKIPRKKSSCSCR